MSTVQRLSQTLRSTQLSTRRVSRTLPTTRHFSSSSSSRSEQTTTTDNSNSPSSPSDAPNTHYKITLLRSAISLGERKKATLKTLGIHRRMQTVFHPHSPECAGKILAVKELVKVENVPEGAVRTKTEMRRERKAKRGYVVVGGLGEKGLSVDGTDGAETGKDERS